MLNLQLLVMLPGLVSGLSSRELVSSITLPGSHHNLLVFLLTCQLAKLLDLLQQFVDIYFYLDNGINYIIHVSFVT